MRALRLSCAVLCLVTFLLGAGPASAQTTSAANFSGPVQLPGVLLPAGSYTFAVIRDGHGVTVADAERRIIATLQVVPISRAAAGDIITMREAVGTAAPEISGLYTSGGTRGVEFLYRRQTK
jgi:hypothetical protein